jgi:hypothetical protein
LSARGEEQGQGAGGGDEGRERGYAGWMRLGERKEEWEGVNILGGLFTNITRELEPTVLFF